MILAAVKKAFGKRPFAEFVRYIKRSTNDLFFPHSTLGATGPAFGKYSWPSLHRFLPNGKDTFNTSPNEELDFDA